MSKKLRVCFLDCLAQDDLDERSTCLTPDPQIAAFLEGYFVLLYVFIHYIYIYISYKHRSEFILFRTCCGNINL